MGSHIGDAGYEIIKDNNYSYYGINNDNGYSWIDIAHDTANGNEVKSGYYNGDYALIGHCESCFLDRGGGWFDNNGAGVFTWGSSRGDGTFRNSFRPVLVV